MVAVAENGATSNQPFGFRRDTPGPWPRSASCAFLAALVGMFVVVKATGGDRRLRLAGYRIRVVLAARLGVVGAAAVVITAATLAVTATVYDPSSGPDTPPPTSSWAAIYSLISVIIGPLLGKVAWSIRRFPNPVS